MFVYTSMIGIILSNPKLLAIFLLDVNHKIPETKESIQDINGIPFSKTFLGLSISKDLNKLIPSVVT